MEPVDSRNAGETARSGDVQTPVGAIAVGTVLDGRYRLDALVGAGATGFVYRARQLDLDRDVAIKLLKQEFDPRTQDLERFRREAIATGRLNHPNIVRVHDFGILPNHQAFLVLEFLAGPNMETWLANHAPIAPNQALDILQPIFAAVQAIHNAGIVHRDLKPSNIILPAEGDALGAVKVVDFSIARFVSSQSKLTGSFPLGTPAYMSPEVIDGEPADQRSDIYSLGTIAFEMLTGRQLFVGQTPSAVMLAHLTKPPTPPSTCNPAVSVEVDSVVLKALQKHPSDRFTTTTDFAVAFDHAVRDGQGVPIAHPHPIQPSKTAVLVVEDDFSTRRTIEAVLSQKGFDITTAEDGADALLAIGTHPFGLIISDIDMPHLDGWALLEVVKKKKIDIPVILLTSHESMEDEVRGFELGAVDFLKKPFSPAVLLARVRKALAP